MPTGEHAPATTVLPPAIDLSIVIPMHNEAAGVDALFDRLVPVLSATGLRCEIVCVNDGSTDDTLARVLERARRHPPVLMRVVDLSRNFGKEIALTAGLDICDGRAVVPLDADLQDPPEVIAQLIAKWREGYEVVYAVRGDRAQDPLLKRMTALLFYRVFNAVAKTRIPVDTGDFRLMDRKVVLALRRLPERTRLMKGIFAWVGFRHTGVTYARPARRAGSSAWSNWALLRLAIDGIVSFSSLPLRLWAMVGSVIALGAFAYGAFLVAHVLIYGRDVPGYASLMVVGLFAFGIQLITLGTIGEYLSRVFDEVKQRPLYIVREEHRIDGGEDAGVNGRDGSA
ncbi:MAG: glycosyltransferase family 2 protein [Planctomycetes bacterium]|nr:glycosyltransferase family 2 protein [Planctomycetota bacterium]